jgi:hypothetical protein
VAATGAVIVRAERRRRAYTPDEVRERLHARLAESAAAGDQAVAGGQAAGNQAADGPPG